MLYLVSYLGLILFCLFAPLRDSVVHAQTPPITTSTAILVWNSNTEPDMKNYIMLMGTVEGVYTRDAVVLHVEGGATQTGEFSNLLEGQTYFFSVRACDASGNCSEPAIPVSGKVLIPPGVPSGLGVKIRLNISVEVP